MKITTHHAPLPDPTIPDRDSVSEPLVAFVGCTDWNVDAEPYYPNGQSLSCYNDLQSTFPSPNLCLSPETTVALAGCTGVDDADLSHTNHPSSLLPPILNNIGKVSPEPTVALSGYTGVDGDMDVSCPLTIPSTLPPTSPDHSTDPDIPFPLNDPDNTLTSSPDPRVPFNGDTFVINSNPAVNTSDDIPFNPDPDVDNTPEFSTIWASKLPAVMDFESFSNVCEDLAEAVVNKSRSMSNKPSGAKKSPRPAANRPNHRAPHPKRNRVRSNPLEAR